MGVKVCMNCKHGAIPEFNEPCASCDHCSNWESPVPQWISVEDRLPEHCEDVLVATMLTDDGERDTEIAYFSLDGWRRPGGILFGAVTHWMPLPEPPKDEERQNAKWEE